MTLHLHVTPITPNAVLHQLAGCNFLVSYFRPDQLRLAQRVGQVVWGDNGAFSAWRKGIILDAAWWRGYHLWCETELLIYPTACAIIPDVIDAGSQEQDALIREWPHGHRGIPVWHMDEPIERLLRLCEAWPKVAIGSTAEYRHVGSDAWRRRMDDVWTALAAQFGLLPWIHMLRGMQCCTWGFPFASLDSGDVAQNHSRGNRSPRERAHRWDAQQCPARWEPRPVQMEMVDA